MDEIIKISLIVLAIVAFCFYMGERETRNVATPVKGGRNDHREPPFYPRREPKRKPRYDADAERMKAILLTLYTPKEDFTIVLNKRRLPARRMGTYHTAYRNIIVYCRWGEVLETSIHEYAHHIFETEHRTERKTKCHGKGFKQILSMLGERYKEVYGRTLSLR